MLLLFLFYTQMKVTTMTRQQLKMYRIKKQYENELSKFDYKVKRLAELIPQSKVNIFNPGIRLQSKFKSTI